MGNGLCPQFAEEAYPCGFVLDFLQSLYDMFYLLSEIINSLKVGSAYIF